MKDKQTKRAEAKQRNEAWDALPFVTKLDRLHRRPGMCQRQRNRLMAATTSKIKQRTAERREVTS